jgi:hypothetical protein
VAEGDLDPRLLYVNGRKKYSRPSGMLWSENSGTLVEDPASITTPKKKIYVPIGFEVGTDPESIEDESLIDQFLFLTDDNRQPIDIKTERIEKRERMINGRMRSYHIADKTTVSVNWDMIPSRSHENFPNFDPATGLSPHKSYTTDGGAGGADMLEWYDSHKGSFWVFLAYDRKGIFKGTPEPYDHLRQYNQLIEMFISDFSYSVEKRGTKFDYWNVSVTLEEV